MMLRVALVLVLLAGCARSEPRPNGTASCCVSSTSAKPVTTGAASPEDAWKNVLASLQAGDDAALARAATPAGIASLEKGVSGEDKHVAFARWGKGWAAWEIRWKKRDAERAEAVLGPEVKEHGLTFVKTPEGWKLDRWMPGE